MVPDGDYLVIRVGHPVSGVLVDEQAGEIRIPFGGEQSVMVAAAHLTIEREKRGTVIAGVVEHDG